MVTSDYETPLTGYEPKKDLNLTNAEELDLATTSDIYWQHTLAQAGYRKLIVDACRAPPGWSSVVPVLAALLCLLCFHSGFSTLVISGALWCLLTFLGLSSVCERDVQEEPQQVSQSSAEGPLSHVTGQHACGILTA